MRRTEFAALAVVPVLFAGAVLLFTPLRVSFHLDEAVYASQISQHPAMPWGGERARGMPLVVAPVTLLSSSVIVMRAYLAITAAIAMYLASLAWRGIRATWVIVLATAIFGGLAVTQEYASLVYPNYWAAIGALTAAGLALRAVTIPTVRDLVFLAVAVAFTGLVRPTDAAVLFLPLAVIVVLARKKGSWPVAAAVAGGLAIAFGEWLVESYRYFGGISSRLHQATAAGGGSRFDLLRNLEITGGGGTAPVPGHLGVTGWSHPQLLIWWAVFLALALVGVWVAQHHDGWLLAVLPLVCALALYLGYSVPVLVSARYLLPAWALIAMPAAEGAVWLAGRQTAAARVAALAAVSAFVLIELVTQHPLVVTHSAEIEVPASHADQIVRKLQRQGVHSPCLITSVPKPGFSGFAEPAAFSLGCSYHWDMASAASARHARIVVMVEGKAKPWPYAAGWRRRRVGGGAVAYIQPWPPGQEARANNGRKGHHHKHRRARRHAGQRAVASG